MRKYKIPSGTSGAVRKSGSLNWKFYITTKTLEFTKCVGTPGGTWWIFRQAGWELRVLPKDVERIRQADPPPPPGVLPVHGGWRPTGYKKPSSFGTTGGKGASRRRNMRAAKRRK